MSYAIFRLARAHRGYAAQLLRPLNLYAGQELIIMSLHENGPQTQAQLVQIERLDHSTVAKSLRRMENAGLVARRPSEEDRRATIVSLTPKGRVVHKKISAVWTELERASTEGLDAAEIARLLPFMAKIERIVVAASSEETA